MRLSDTAIKNPVFAWMLMAGMIIFGIISFHVHRKKPTARRGFPHHQRVHPLGRRLAGSHGNRRGGRDRRRVTSVKGVKKINSTSRLGQASIIIEFDLKTDVDVALQEVQSTISQAQFNLPKDLDPPIIAKFNPEDQPFMWLSVSGDRPLRYLMELVRDNLKQEFTTIPGVGNVFLGGYVEPVFAGLAGPPKNWTPRNHGSRRGGRRSKRTQRAPGRLPDLPHQRMEPPRHGRNQPTGRIQKPGHPHPERRAGLPHRSNSKTWPPSKMGWPTPGPFPASTSNPPWVSAF
jgi:hypothetical protein